MQEFKKKEAKRIITTDRTPNPGIDIVLNLNYSCVLKSFKNKLFNITFAFAIVEHFGNDKLFLLDFQKVAKAVIGTMLLRMSNQFLNFLVF